MKLIILLLLAVNIAWAFPPSPHSALTNPTFCTRTDVHFDGVRYKDKVPHCRRYVSQSTRNTVYNAYQVPVWERGNYTIDHLVPLALGGSNSIYNLWPQHKSISTVTLEGKLYRQLNNGEIHINEALNTILRVKYRRHP